MSKVAWFLAIFLTGEACAFFAFLFVKKVFEKKWRWCIDLQTVKGWLERLFLFLCLALGLPHALIAFGALKIGTRVNDRENRVGNDYFFIGNIISLLLVVSYYAVWLIL